MDRRRLEKRAARRSQGQIIRWPGKMVRRRYYTVLTFPRDDISSLMNTSGSVRATIRGRNLAVGRQKGNEASLRRRSDGEIMN